MLFIASSTSQPYDGVGAVVVCVILLFLVGVVFGKK